MFINCRRRRRQRVEWTAGSVTVRHDSVFLSGKFSIFISWSLQTTCCTQMWYVKIQIVNAPVCKQQENAVKKKNTKPVYQQWRTKSAEVFVQSNHICSHFTHPALFTLTVNIVQWKTRSPGVLMRKDHDDDYRGPNCLTCRKGKFFTLPVVRTTLKSHLSGSGLGATMCRVLLATLLLMSHSSGDVMFHVIDITGANITRVLLFSEVHWQA